MKLEPIHTKLTESDNPRTYNVVITDKETGEVVQNYDTKVAIIFGAENKTIKEKLEAVPLYAINLGTPDQVAQLLAIVNDTVMNFLRSAWNKQAKLGKKGGETN